PCHRRRHRPVLVADVTDLHLDEKCDLAPTKLQKIAPAAPPKSASLSKITRPLGRKPPRLIDKAVPNIDIGNSCLLSLAAVKFVEIRRVIAGVCAALGGQANPDDRNAGTLQCRDGRIDALDVSEFPLFRLEFPRSIGRLARLCRRQLGMLLLDWLPLQIRSRRWDCRGRLYRLRVRRGGRRSLLTDGLAIVVSDHHDH